MAALDAEAVRAAYRRWAGVYDAAFGRISAPARRMAIERMNALPGEQRVLEVGVGTGLALPLYAPGKRVTGIDLSADMLALAHERVRDLGLDHVDSLLEMDAEHTDFPNGRFDAAAAMFVASVVPNPRRLFAEMQRIVKPGGLLLFVNHFVADRGPRLWLERALAPASHALGWHPDFSFEALMPPEELSRAERVPVPPGGIFTLVALTNRRAGSSAAGGRGPG